MEYIEFFLFCIFAFGIPISLVLIKHKQAKNDIRKLPLLESGIPQKNRATNRHKNKFYPISLMMLFTYIPLLLLIPILVFRKSGEEYNQQIIMGLIIISSSFLGYWIFRFSGGFNDPQ